MKQLKKYPRKQLEKFSTVFMQLGLVLSLFVVYVIIEHQTKVKAQTAEVFDTPDKDYIIDLDRPIIFEKVELPKPEPKLPEPKVSNNLSDIDKIDNDDKKTIEAVIDKPIETKPQIFNPEDIIEVNPEDVFDEDVPFLIIEDAPIYKGCEGLSKEENKKCFVSKITKHVQKHFNSGLSEDLGLRSGKHKMYAQFIIDKKGNVVEVKVRAPHKRLEKEAQRIVNKIPQFTPGKQRGKEVKVKYTLPITFYVE